MTGGENRKKRIDRDIYSYIDRSHSYYDNLHQYSKNKIHCSCPMCAAKTKNKGPRKRIDGRLLATTKSPM